MQKRNWFYADKSDIVGLISEGLITVQHLRVLYEFLFLAIR